jgi:hypothetical protein
VLCSIELLPYILRNNACSRESHASKEILLI